MRERKKKDEKVERQVMTGQLSIAAETLEILP